MCDLYEDKQIGDISYHCFTKLGKSGKPKPKSEYTVLATIVCNVKNHTNDSIDTKVVALTTGTKCFASNESSSDDLIVDNHAESLLKRAFKRYLICRLQSGHNLDDIQTITLFVSQLPCGSLQRWKGDPDLEANSSKSNRHLSDVCRKPGRGVTCYRATCLKKIAKWIRLGLQGKALIALTGRPFYINNIVIGNCGQSGEYDQQMLTNMLSMTDICTVYNGFQMNYLPKIKFCHDFRYECFIKSDAKYATSTSLVMWLTGDGHKVTEVLTEGHKLGVIVKNRSRNKPLICDSCIHRDIGLLSCELNDKLTEEYNNQWIELKKCKLFGDWPSVQSLNTSSSNDIHVIYT
ncbi:tRNA-specific adenosine deaminase 1-like [Oppia nitens]|uniref:tRNA-specific adenosine deaminase 1-like n=1 Tax=Oppia nitens TaxID=1686743 RepID=UPI0023DC83C0|nr:tRNA-specific adenosine deaminase 1-like [Oppia nitens]